MPTNCGSPDRGPPPATSGPAGHDLGAPPRSVTVIEIIRIETRGGDLDEARRFQDPDLLICPVCGEKAYPEPPVFWAISDGAARTSPRGPLLLCPGPGACR